MKKNILFLIEALFSIGLGIFILSESQTKILGAVTGTYLPLTASAIWGVFFLLTGITLLSIEIKQFNKLY